MSRSEGLEAAAALLVLAGCLGISARILPPGGMRRTAEEAALILVCATPALALLTPYLRHHLWAPAAVIACGYGSFYVIRSYQLRRANRDTPSNFQPWRAGDRASEKPDSTMNTTTANRP